MKRKANENPKKPTKKRQSIAKEEPREESRGIKTLLELRTMELTKKRSHLANNEPTQRTIIKHKNPKVYIAIYGEKGGVGKTTLTSSIGFLLAKKGKRVLMYDCDPQRNLTTWCFGKEITCEYNDNVDSFINSQVRAEEEYATLYEQVDVQTKRSGERVDYSVRPAHAIQIDSNLYLVPGHREMLTLSEKISVAEEMTRRDLSGMTNYYTARPFLSVAATAEKFNVDYILLDLNPSRGILNQRLIAMCDYLIVPCMADYFGYQVISNLNDDLTNWKNSLEANSVTANDNPVYQFPMDRLNKVKFLGVIINNYHPVGGHYGDIVNGLVQDKMIANQRIWFERINTCANTMPILHGNLDRNSNILAKIRHYWQLNYISSIFFVPVPLLNRDHAWKNVSNRYHNLMLDDERFVKMANGEIEPTQFQIETRNRKNADNSTASSSNDNNNNNKVKKTFLEQVDFFKDVFDKLIEYILDISENNF